MQILRGENCQKKEKRHAVDVAEIGIQYMRSIYMGINGGYI